MIEQEREIIDTLALAKRLIDEAMDEAYRNRWESVRVLASDISAELDRLSYKATKLQVENDKQNKSADSLSR